MASASRTMSTLADRPRHADRAAKPAATAGCTNTRRRPDTRREYQTHERFGEHDACQNHSNTIESAAGWLRLRPRLERMTCDRELSVSNVRSHLRTAVLRWASAAARGVAAVSEVSLIRTTNGARDGTLSGLAIRLAANRDASLRATLDRLYADFNYPDSAADPIQIVRRFVRPPTARWSVSARRRSLSDGSRASSSRSNGS